MREHILSDDPATLLNRKIEELIRISRGSFFNHAKIRGIRGVCHEIYKMGFEHGVSYESEKREGISKIASELLYGEKEKTLVNSKRLEL